MEMARVKASKYMSLAETPRLFLIGFFLFFKVIITSYIYMFAILL